MQGRHKIVETFKICNRETNNNRGRQHKDRQQFTSDKNF